MNGRPAAPPPCLPAAMCTDKALGMFVTEANAAAIPATLWWLSVDVVAGGSQDSASQAQLLILTPQQTIHLRSLLVAPSWRRAHRGSRCHGPNSRLLERSVRTRPPPG